MNADLKAKWIAALRSGDYRQVQGYLHNEGGFCCLGVLCDLAAVPFTEGPSDDTDGLVRFYDFGARHRNEEMICGDMREGLKTGFSDLALELAEMNDHGRSFAEIADWIEANIPAEAE